MEHLIAAILDNNEVLTSIRNFFNKKDFLKVSLLGSAAPYNSIHLYEFTVPDYPDILNRLGESHLDNIEENLKKFLKKVL